MATTELESEKPDKGLECRNCGCRHLPVDHTHKTKGKIIRYRHCRYCGRRMTTCERVVG